MKEDLDTAIEYYLKALEINSEKSDCLYNLGNAYCLKGNYPDALASFKRCSEIDPTNASSFYNLANVYYLMSD